MGEIGKRMGSRGSDQKKGIKESIKVRIKGRGLKWGATDLGSAWVAWVGCVVMVVGRRQTPQHWLRGGSQFCQTYCKSRVQLTGLKGSKSRSTGLMLAQAWARSPRAPSCHKLNNRGVDSILVFCVGCVCRKEDNVISRGGGIWFVFLSMASLFVVRVLVLSEHRVVTTANPLITVIWITIALNSTHWSPMTTVSTTSGASTPSAAFPSTLARACDIWDDKWDAKLSLKGKEQSDKWNIWVCAIRWQTLSHWLDFELEKTQEV